jgi:hypothetical protein
MNALRHALFVVVLAVMACSPGYEGATVVDQAPSDASFGSVVAPLGYFCGSLDCHGAPGRNLRLYSRQGLRLDPTDVPCGGSTTDREIAADYRAVIGLEPEVLASVVRDHGAHPERLTLIRKARGTEKHAGGVVFAEGTDGDLCLVTWIRGQTDEAIADCNNTIPQNPVPLCAP